tara:strand:+ start:441 stop:728 length:288 start_codon:yes stop_codon:yes gene_type:complete
MLVRSGVCERALEFLNDRALQAAKQNRLSAGLAFRKKILRFQLTTTGCLWVVPYSPYLTLKYGAHINIKVCSSTRAFTYLFLYMFGLFPSSTSRG